MTASVTDAHVSRPVRRVVILGGGFAGVSAAIELGRLARDDPALDVHFVSDENYFVFQPLLPEVVGCRLDPGHILNPIRQLCPGACFHCASVGEINIPNRFVSLTGADARRTRRLDFDHLIVALGQVIDLSRIPGLAEHTLPIKTLGDAFHLRNHVLTRLEEADIEPDDAIRRRLLTFVAIGGGFSGVETMAEINDMVKSCFRFYPRAKRTGTRMILIHSRDRILNELTAELADFAAKKLAQRGVEILFNERVKEATPTGVHLESGKMIEASTVVCTVGNAPHPVIRTTPLPQERGRILTDEYLRVRHHENVWAAGDAALIPDVLRGGYCPPTAQYASRQGALLAHNVVSTIQRRPLRPFTFAGLGQLAIVGHRCGVAQVFGRTIAGVFAWWLWRSVYLLKLPGLRAKLRVAADWTLDLMFPRDITKIDLSRTERLGRAHFCPGEYIIRQGEVGDRFYVIESGEVEILREQPDGPPERIAVRKTGESFGEIALLHDTPRTSSVRCLTPTDVVTFTRTDFRTLIGSYAALRQKIEADAAERSAANTQPNSPQ